MLKKALVVALAILLLCPAFFSLSAQSVSASTNQIFWGAYVGTESRMPLSTLQTFEDQVGKNVSIWNWLQWWIDGTDQFHDPNFNFVWMNECRDHGAIPMVSWAPSTVIIAGRYAGYLDILNGKFDAYLDKWGRDSATWGHPYFVRLEWEFNGDWSGQPYEGNANRFVAQWQYIVNRVRAAGGTQISWIWCPYQGMESVETLRTVYPGDQYVDWVGTDVYTTLDFAQTYLGEIRQIAPNKPVMLPEMGYSSDNGNTGAYWTKTLSDLQTKYQYIKGFCLWEYPEGENLTVADSATLPSFKQGISSSYYSSNVYGSLSISPIAAIGGTPNPTNTQSLSSPTSTSTYSFAFLFRMGLSYAIIVCVIATIAVAAVSIVLRKRYMKNIKIEDSERERLILIQNPNVFSFESNFPLFISTIL